MINGMIERGDEQTLQPRFQHDCDCCVFLGPVDICGQRWDIWTCPPGESSNHHIGSSLIARYGDEGHEYVSRPPFLSGGGISLSCAAMSAAHTMWVIYWGAKLNKHGVTVTVGDETFSTGVVQHLQDQLEKSWKAEHRADKLAQAGLDHTRNLLAIVNNPIGRRKLGGSHLFKEAVPAAKKWLDDWDAEMKRVDAELKRILSGDDDD